MKKLTAIIFILASFAASKADAQTARLQVIHNAADPAAAVVDIYVNNSMLLDNFAFRSATSFIDVPAETQLNIGIAPGNSNSPNDIIAVFPVTLMRNRTYVAIANGVLNPGSFAANPEGINIAFNLFARDRIREHSRFHRMIDLVVFHGASDAPSVDVLIRGAGRRKIANNLSFREISNYRSVWPEHYIIDITPENDNTEILASFSADLSGLAGSAAVVFASGFLNPANNQNGPSFGLFAALPNGAVVALPVEEPTARLQIIHNAADPAAGMVDIYVNGSRLLNDFAFRTATPFLDVPAETPLEIGVAPANSDSAGDAIATFNVVLERGRTYAAIANGVLAPAAFAPNPEGSNISFNLFAKDEIREASRIRGLVDIIVFHGATDAPAVDVVVHCFRNWPLFNDLSYGRFSSYRSLPAIEYRLDITPADNNNVTVASFNADLTSLRGGSVIVFASGFLDPNGNQNGPAFGLYAALADGRVVALPPAGAMVLAKADGDESLPVEFSLNKNYPNPFNPSTTISFSLAEPSPVKLTVFNMLGQEVATLVDAYLEAGLHRVEFNGTDVPSGVYFYRIDAGSYSQTQKMTLLK